MSSDTVVSIENAADGFGHKEWTNPAETDRRIYLHRFEGKQKLDCGYFDVLKSMYLPPKRSNRKADNIPYCLDGEGDTVMTIRVGEEVFSITKQTAPNVVVASNNKSTVISSSEPQKVLEHLASVTRSDTKIVVSYGNTVEVKSKSRYGNIQTQYPKLSMQVEMEGGNTLSNIEAVADNVVALVESKLTRIIQDLVG